MDQQRPGLLPGEKIIVLQGRGAQRMPHLATSFGPLEFLNRSEALRAASRVNGIPYKHKGYWLVRFEF
jgi:hypothetical protein